jgi:hypothetical protein
MDLLHFYRALLCPNWNHQPKFAFPSLLMLNIKFIILQYHFS